MSPGVESFFSRKGQDDPKSNEKNKYVSYRSSTDNIIDFIGIGERSIHTRGTQLQG
jgi:hypothetical protein